MSQHTAYCKTHDLFTEWLMNKRQRNNTSGYLPLSGPKKRGMYTQALDVPKHTTQPDTEGEVLLIQKWQHVPCVPITKYTQKDLHG